MQGRGRSLKSEKHPGRKSEPRKIPEKSSRTSECVLGKLCKRKRVAQVLFFSTLRLQGNISGVFSPHIKEWKESETQKNTNLCHTRNTPQASRSTSSSSQTRPYTHRGELHTSFERGENFGEICTALSRRPLWKWKSVPFQLLILNLLTRLGTLDKQLSRNCDRHRGFFFSCTTPPPSNSSILQIDNNVALNLNATQFPMTLRSFLFPAFPLNFYRETVKRKLVPQGERLHSFPDMLVLSLQGITMPLFEWRWKGGEHFSWLCQLSPCMW